jgi:hypothetical protein
VGASKRRGVGRWQKGAALACTLVAAACSSDFDASRTPEPRGTIGEELYAFICDRVGAQALREDLTGASFRAVCHKTEGGLFADSVDLTRLPPIQDGALNTEGKPVPRAAQEEQRRRAVGRVEALAKKRGELIAAFDALFPDTTIEVVDNKNSDPGASCTRKGVARLGPELSDLLGRLTNLYNDGTIPESTRSLARLLDAFKRAPEAQLSWSRVASREGYRPLETALGVARPALAYPRLRELSNATLSVLSEDSKPFDPKPEYDAKTRKRIPVPGPAYGAFTKLLEVTSAELFAATADPAPAPLVSAVDPARTLEQLSRPRTNLEMMQALLYTEDDAFQVGSGATFIVRRDARGLALVVPAQGGALPAPFVDATGPNGTPDGLPDVDELGRFVTSNGRAAPSPFLVPGLEPGGARDPERGFALDPSSGRPLYGYLQTNRTFAASLLRDLKPLVRPAAEAPRGALMDALAGAPAMFGSRSTKTKTYEAADGPTSVTYEAFDGTLAPATDLVYALGVLMDDRGFDETLQVVRTLLTTENATLARLTAGVLAVRVVAEKFPDVKLPDDAAFWDEFIDVAVKIAKVPGLLEAIVTAVADDTTVGLSTAFGNFMKFSDRITYDRNNLNGPTFNATLNRVAPMQTPVDRSKPDQGFSRSGFQRFLQLLHDANGVTACNKAGAKARARLGGISVDLPLSGTFRECEAFKIDNMAKFYVQSIVGKADLYLRDGTLRNGIVGIGAATVGLMEDSSGITGFWTPNNSRDLRPKPQWLNRLVFFDVQGDSANGGPNARTNQFLRDLNPLYLGSSMCPVRVIDDPQNDKLTAPDRKVRLRNCQNGDWLQQRNADTIFVLEQFGFYESIAPLVRAFSDRDQEDLFIEAMEALHRHWPKDPTDKECVLSIEPNARYKTCPKTGLSAYEPITSEALGGDLLAGANQLVKRLQTTTVKRCTALSGDGRCGTTADVTGIAVLTETTRTLLDPDRAKEKGLTDRTGKASVRRNDGTENPQVTPLYLLLDGITGFDRAFAAYAAKNGEEDGRQAPWRRARSQIVDQFFSVSGDKATASFANPLLPKLGPRAVDLVRAQLHANCPRSFAPPFERCAWGRVDLTKKWNDATSGPLFASSIDLLDAVRRDEAARVELEALLSYLLDAASDNDALASMLAAASDAVQLLQDDENLVPLFRVLAEATRPSSRDAEGRVVEKGLVDAQLALLAKVSGKAFDEAGKQVCSREIDPNQVLAEVLSRLVTPMAAPGPVVGKTPLEVVVDAIADINRVDPDLTTKLAATDYANIADQVSQFLLDKESGLEQFYEIVRRGTSN